MADRVHILGVPVDAVTLRQAVYHMKFFLASGSQHQVVTPNPEMIVAAQRNKNFLKVLHASSLNVPDGAGLLWAARKTRQLLPERVAGTDLLQELCNEDDIGGVFLLGAAPGIASKAAHVLQKNNPRLRIVGTYAGSPSLSDERFIIERINASGARALFVAYGAPAQELWIHRNLKNMLHIRVAMGVGGAFDFLSGKTKRAPKLLRVIGLEWTWRLILQPTRIGRIWTAVVVFPLLVLKDVRRKTSDIRHKT